MFSSSSVLSISLSLTFFPGLFLSFIVILFFHFLSSSCYHPIPFFPCLFFSFTTPLLLFFSFTSFLLPFPFFPGLFLSWFHVPFSYSLSFPLFLGLFLFLSSSVPHIFFLSLCSRPLPFFPGLFISQFHLPFSYSLTLPFFPGLILFMISPSFLQNRFPFFFPGLILSFLSPSFVFPLSLFLPHLPSPFILLISPLPGCLPLSILQGVLCVWWMADREVSGRPSPGPEWEPPTPSPPSRLSRAEPRVRSSAAPGRINPHLPFSGRSWPQ